MYDATVRATALGLLAKGLSESVVAGRSGISRSTLRRWREDPRGPAAGARPCPSPLAPSESYAALFGFYLGDGHITKLAGYHALRIACDARQDGIIRDVERLILDVHPDRPTHRVRKPGCIAVQSNWKHWPCLFPQHGPGRKHERRLVMADWQQAAVVEYPGAFLRGLFHSDGCLVKNWARRPVAGQPRRYEYPRWQFVNESADIMKWCREALDLAGISYRQTKPRVLSVSRRADVAALTAIIGVKS